jgi:hypothetical protein
MRFLTRDRLGDESDGDEEADLADRQGERPERLVVVVGGCPGVQLVGDAGLPFSISAVLVASQ